MTLATMQAVTLPSWEDIHQFYALYAETLDEARLDSWIDYFSDPCVYQIIARENWEAGQQLCFMQADSKGMIIDRVQGIQRTQIFRPRSYRRFYSGLRVVGAEGEEILVRQNVLVVQTLIDEVSRIIICGVAHDRLVREDDRLRFRRRTIVSDSELIENSLIYPL